MAAQQSLREPARSRPARPPGGMTARPAAAPLARWQRAAGNSAVSAALRPAGTAVVHRCGAVPHEVCPCNPDREADPAARMAARLAAEVPGLRGLASTPDRGPDVQRQEAAAGPTSGSAEVEDPGFVLCLALCYLGIPPALWKSAVEMFLTAVWEEYRVVHGQARAEAEFRSYREEFRLYSPVKVAKLVLTFAVEGKLGPIPVRTAAARALQGRVMAFLAARGASAAAVATAAQVLRKVTVAVEVAFAAGCAAYCGGLAYARTVTEMTTAVVEGVAAVGEVLGGIGRGIAEGLGRVLSTARATVDPANWDLSALPGPARADIAVLGAYLWHYVDSPDADTFLANIARPLGTYAIPPVLLRDIAVSMSRAASGRTGFTIEFTPELLGQLTPLAFAQLLRDWRLLTFRRDPEAASTPAPAATP